MDQLSREETMKLMDYVSRQYGDNVLMQFSGDALDIMPKRWGTKEHCFLRLCKNIMVSP